jgi:hypothetical protein
MPGMLKIGTSLLLVIACLVAAACPAAAVQEETGWDKFVQGVKNFANSPIGKEIQQAVKDRVVSEIRGRVVNGGGPQVIQLGGPQGGYGYNTGTVTIVDPRQGIMQTPNQNIGTGNFNNGKQRRSTLYNDGTTVTAVTVSLSSIAIYIDSSSAVMPLSACIHCGPMLPRACMPFACLTKSLRIYKISCRLLKFNLISVD